MNDGRRIRKGRRPFFGKSAGTCPAMSCAVRMIPPTLPAGSGTEKRRNLCGFLFRPFPNAGHTSGACGGSLSALPEKDEKKWPAPFPGTGLLIGKRPFRRG